MQKRGMIFGSYNTAGNGWTLASWTFPAAEQKTYFVDRPGGNGSWDLSTAMTDDQPTYYDRTLTVTLECSEGTRMTRKAEIRRMVGLLDGRRLNIVLPDDPDYYVTGRIHVDVDYNDLAHASVTVTAVCDPWMYKQNETIYQLTAGSNKTIKLINSGQLALVPTIVVIGANAQVDLTFNAAKISLGAGTYRWPELFLTPGEHELSYSASQATATITFREAVLA